MAAGRTLGQISVRRDPSEWRRQMSGGKPTWRSQSALHVLKQRNAPSSHAGSLDRDGIPAARHRREWQCPVNWSLLFGFPDHTSGRLSRACRPGFQSGSCGALAPAVASSMKNPDASRTSRSALRAIRSSRSRVPIRPWLTCQRTPIQYFAKSRRVSRRRPARPSETFSQSKLRREGTTMDGM